MIGPKYLPLPSDYNPVMGDIIEKATFYNDDRKEKDQLTLQELTLEISQEVEINSKEYKLKSTEEKDEIELDYAVQLANISKQMWALRRKMFEGEAEKTADFELPFSMYSIPWDSRCKIITRQNSDSYIENCFTISFNNSSNVSATLKKLSFDLVSGFPVECHSILSDKTLSELTNHINKVVNVIDLDPGAPPTATLFASCIALERFKSMSPLMLRKNACIGERLENNASKLCVLAECQLGGWFLELTAGVKGKGLEFKSLFLDMKGALISIIKSDNRYADWKNILLNKQDSGYPIGCKVEDFENILKKV